MDFEEIAFKILLVIMLLVVAGMGLLIMISIIKGLFL